MMAKPWFRHMFDRLLVFLPVLLMTGDASAQTLGDSSQELCIPPSPTSLTLRPQTKLLTSTEEVSYYLNCSTIYASIRIISDNITTLDLSPITEFRYSFTVISSYNISSIIAPNLHRIGQDFLLDNLPVLQVLELPKLEFAGRVSWNSLTRLKDVPSLKAESVVIPAVSDGTADPFPPAPLTRLQLFQTGLSRFDFFKLDDPLPSKPFEAFSPAEKKAARISITENPDLESISFDSLEGGISGLEITRNNPSCHLSMDALKSVAGNVTFLRMGSFSLPNLEDIAGDLLVSYADVSDILLPQLRTITGSLDVTSNPSLLTLSLPSLTKVNNGDEGKVQIWSNPLLKSIDMPVLKTAASIQILSNGKLETLGMGSLQFVGEKAAESWSGRGGFGLRDNPLLERLDGFAEFQFAVGPVTFVGGFESITINRLTSPLLPATAWRSPPTNKSLTILSTNPKFNCEYWSHLHRLMRPAIPFTCSVALSLGPNPSPSSTSSPRTNIDPDVNSSSDPESEKTGLTTEVAGVLIAVAMTILIGIAGFAFWRRRVMKATLAQQRGEAERRGAGVELSGLERGGRDGLDGVVRMLSEEEERDRPPLYTRVPKPGECPPGYGEVFEGVVVERVEVVGSGGNGDGNGVRVGNVSVSEVVDEVVSGTGNEVVNGGNVNVNGNENGGNGNGNTRA